MASWLVLNTDASIRPSGEAAIGVVLRRKPRPTEPMRVIAYISEAVGHMKPQEAEYHALIAGLNLALQQPATEPPTNLQVFVDSSTVADQVNEKARVRQQPMKDLHADVLELLKAIGKERYRLSWLPRELNREADQRASDAFFKPRESQLGPQMMGRIWDESSSQVDTLRS